MYRTILQLPTYTANSAIRGDIGASSCYARDMKIKILFAKHLLKENRNELIRNIFLKEFEITNVTKWIKTLKTYMKKIDINLTQIIRLSKHNIIEKIKKWDTREWKEEIQTKSTLSIYSLYKRNIKEESWVDNTLGSKLIMRARTNSLTLNWRNRFQKKSEQSLCCECETETLEHFLLDCEEYCDIRLNQSFLLNTNNENRNIIGNILLFEVLTEEEIETRKECDKILEKKTKKS